MNIHREKKRPRALIIVEDQEITANFEETGLGPEPSFLSLTPDGHTSSMDMPVNFTLIVGDGDGVGHVASSRALTTAGFVCRGIRPRPAVTL